MTRCSIVHIFGMVVASAKRHLSVSMCLFIYHMRNSPVSYLCNNRLNCNTILYGLLSQQLLNTSCKNANSKSMKRIFCKRFAVLFIIRP